MFGSGAPDDSIGAQEYGCQGSPVGKFILDVSSQGALESGIREPPSPPSEAMQNEEKKLKIDSKNLKTLFFLFLRQNTELDGTFTTTMPACTRTAQNRGVWPQHLF